MEPGWRDIHIRIRWHDAATEELKQAVYKTLERVAADFEELLSNPDMEFVGEGQPLFETVDTGTETRGAQSERFVIDCLLRETSRPPKLVARVSLVEEGPPFRVKLTFRRAGDVAHFVDRFTRFWVLPNLISAGLEDLEHVLGRGDMECVCLEDPTANGNMPDSFQQALRGRKRAIVMIQTFAWESVSERLNYITKVAEKVSKATPDSAPLFLVDTLSAEPQGEKAVIMVVGSEEYLRPIFGFV